MYLKSVENVITLGKLIGLLFLFCLPLLSILFLKTKRNDLARPVMGTIFLVTPVKSYHILAWDAPLRPPIVFRHGTATLSVRRISEGCQPIVATVLTAKPSIYSLQSVTSKLPVRTRPPEKNFLFIVKLVR